MSISNHPDPQMKRLYAWEAANRWDKNTISFKRAKEVILVSCDMYGVTLPEVLIHKTRALPWSCPSENIISMQRDKYLNIPIALHEATHHIVYYWYGTRPQDHGPTFLGIYLDLLKRYSFDMYTSAKAVGLRWN